MSYRDDDQDEGSVSPGSGGGGAGSGKKRVWTTEEDEMLKDAVKRHGERAWSRIADELPGRIGKQCRDRWCNHLSPDLDKKKWTDEDDEKLFDAVNRLGNQWAEISRKILPGRSDLSIKNRYYSRLRREHRRAENSGGGGDSSHARSVPQTYAEAVVSDPVIEKLSPKSIKSESSDRGKKGGKKSPAKGSAKKKSAAKGRKPGPTAKKNSGTYGKKQPNSSPSSNGLSSNPLFAMSMPPMPPFDVFGNKILPSTGIGAGASSWSSAAISGVGGFSHNGVGSRENGNSNPGNNSNNASNDAVGGANTWGTNSSDQQGNTLGHSSSTLNNFLGGNPYSWGFQSGFNPNSAVMFSHPYSPITSLSTTPVPSPPRSPSVHPVSMQLPPNLSGLTALGSGSLSSNTNITASTNAGTESNSRPTSPSFSLPGPSPALGPPLFNGMNLWYPVGGMGSAGLGGQGGAGQGGQGTDAHLSLPNSAGTSPIPTSFSNSSMGQSGSMHQGKDGDMQHLELPSFSSTFAGLPRLFGSNASTRGVSPSSSPSSGPLSLQANASPIGTQGDWFPTIGSRGLEFRQHFRPIYGPGDTLFNELPPSATMTNGTSGGAPHPATIAAALQSAKKKKAAAATSPVVKRQRADGSNTGRWLPEEQHRFEEALAKFGTEWTKITEHVKSRTIVQVRSHAQKYFQKRDPTGMGTHSFMEGAQNHSSTTDKQIELALRSLAEGGTINDEDDDDEDDGEAVSQSENPTEDGVPSSSLPIPGGIHAVTDETLLGVAATMASMPRDELHLQQHVESRG